MQRLDTDWQCSDVFTNIRVIPSLAMKELLPNWCCVAERTGSSSIEVGTYEMLPILCELVKYQLDNFVDLKNAGK